MTINSSTKPDADQPPSGQNTSPRPVEGSGGSPFLLNVALRGTFLVLIIGTVALTLSAMRSEVGPLPFSTILGTLLAATGSAGLVVIADALTPRKHLASVLGIYIGISVGLVAALGFAALLDVVAAAWELNDENSIVWLALAKAVVGMCLVYLSISVVLSTKDDFRLVIPYIQLERRAQGVMPLLLDTSAIIDGRMVDLARTGIVDAPIVIQSYVIDELQTLADSSDRNKRDRGRRGLDVLRNLQEAYPDTRIENARSSGGSVDQRLIETAQMESYRIVTTDSGLTKVALIRNVPVMNVNDVAGSLRQNILPGVRIPVEIIRKGEAEQQGVAFMPDGTMLVIEDGADSIGRTVEVEITNTIQRAGGRLIFARLASSPTAAPKITNDTQGLGASATNQPPERGRPDRSSEDQGSQLPRNPRRKRR